MRVKGASLGWNRGPRQRGAFKHEEYPSGGRVHGHVRACGSWDVSVERNGHREVVSSGTYSGPLRKGCDAADISIKAIIESAKQSARRKREEARG